MARQCGKKDSHQSSSKGILFAFGRSIGFTVFAGLGLAILAALALLPVYERVLYAQYDRDSERAKKADYQAKYSASVLVLDDVKSNDPSCVRKLAHSVQGEIPYGYTLVESSGSPSPTPPPDVIRITPHDKPNPPPHWLTELRSKLQNPAKKRGLLLLMTVSFFIAMLLFSKPDEGDTNPASSSENEDEPSQTP